MLYNLGYGFVSAALMPGSAEWEITFANGEKATVDLVVGADGGRSLVRPLVSDAQVQYTHVNGIEASWDAAKHPELAARVGGGTLWIPGPRAEAHLLAAQRQWAHRHVRVVYQRRRQRVHPRPGDPRAAPARVLQGLGAVGQGPRRRRRPRHPAPAVHAARRPRVAAPRGSPTLIGDAMDLMTPFAGKGANIAMLAGLKLGSALSAARGASKEEFDAKVAEYEKEMFPLAKADAEETEMNMQGFMFGDYDEEGIVEIAKMRWN